MRPEHRFTYSGRSVLISDNGGNIGSGIEGFYVEDTRLLSRAELKVAGEPLRSISASPVEAAGFLAYWEAPEGPGIPKRSIYITHARAVGEGLRELLRVEHYGSGQAACFDLAVQLAADFADLNQIHHGPRKQTAEVETTWDESRCELIFRYCHPELDRAVAIRVQRWV